MNVVDYDDCAYPIRNEFAQSHTRYWQRLSGAGSWFSSQQRIDLAREVRSASACAFCAERKAAVSPAMVCGAHTCVSDLPEAVVEAAHRITTDAARLTQSWYQRLLDDGLSEGQYIEIVGTVVAMVSIDNFARAIGVALRPLPDPGPGEPDHYRPERIEQGPDAWVPMVPAENAGTAEADLWVSGRTGNVIRAMSLVPQEVRTLGDLSAAHYLPHDLVRKAGVDAGRALNRSQIEMVAGRVSALNECFY
jgi:hypothetical protein